MARRRSIWRGAIAGLAGGLVASWVMNEFQTGWSAAAKKIKRSSDQPEGEGTNEENQHDSQDGDDATVKVAKKITAPFRTRPLSKQEKKKAGPIVHYAFGGSMGALYGAVAERLPSVKNGFGMTFATALFLGADEIAVPALGLSLQSPLETKAEDHIYGLVSHLVYGATTELVRRSVRSHL